MCNSQQKSDRTSADDYKSLQSLHMAYENICSFDSYAGSCLGLAVDYGSYLHPGTSDCLVSEPEDPGVLRKRLPWVTEMDNMLEDMAMSAAVRWKDVMSLSGDDAADVKKTSLEHFDK